MSLHNIFICSLTVFCTIEELSWVTYSIKKIEFIFVFSWIFVGSLFCFSFSGVNNFLSMFWVLFGAPRSTHFTLVTRGVFLRRGRSWETSARSCFESRRVNSSGFVIESDWSDFGSAQGIRLVDLRYINVD